MNVKFQGLSVHIENEAGSVRKGKDKNGKPWKTTMSHDYGEIKGTMGIDGDPVDVFLGPNKGAKFVYVFHQTTKDGNRFDEDKVFMGFDNVMDAKEAFFKNYDIPEFFYGAVDTIPLEDFKKKVLETKNDPQMIRASKLENSIQLHAQQDIVFTKGDPVTVDGFHGRGVVSRVDGRRVTIQFRNRMSISRDQIYVHHMSEGNYKSKYMSAAGETPPNDGTKKRIERVGTQFCIRADGADTNFGCWPSYEMAQAVLAGKSFIEPLLPDNLYAGGAGSGRHKEFEKIKTAAINEYKRVYKLAKQAGLEEPKAKDAAMDAFILKFKSLRPTELAAGGPGSGRKPKYAKGLNEWKSPEKERELARKDPKQMTLPLKSAGVVGLPKFKIKAPYRGTEHNNIKVPKHAGASHVGKIPGHPKNHNPKGIMLEANDWGEPNAGAYQHAHIEPRTWFSPPSLAKRGKGNHVPTDDPGEKDDKFLDVTKRKKAQKDRMKLLRRSAPGGLPPQVPVRTSLVSPVLPFYPPITASRVKAGNLENKRMFRAYGAARI